ncbi:MAG: hypothetical protein GC165_07465 [Armatimonadetes bacterium]|nr:hypothetical protein [Armatimonadota bacterium]
MSHSAFPTQAEVEAFLTSVSASFGSYDCSGDLAAAIGIVERETGWLPFLMDAADVTRTFDPPMLSVQGFASPNNGLMVPLRAGLLSVTSVVVDSTPLVQNQDFWLEPSYRLPWSWIKFRTTYIAPPQSLAITGKWGYSATVPDDLWTAVRDYAAYHALSNLQASTLASPLDSWTEADIKENYGKKDTVDLLESKLKQLTMACKAYRRNV